MNYYPFHLGDYAAHTAHLEPMEDIAYRRMLDLYYRTERPLPLDTAEIARLIRLRDHAETVRDILREFFTETEEGFRHERCDKEIATFQAMAEGGRKGAAKRWAKAGDSPPIAPPSPPHADPNANQNQNQNQNQNHKTKTARKRAAPAALVSVQDLVSEGIDAQCAADWLAVRKSKHLPLTATAWDDTKAEAVKAGMSAADAVQMAARQSWAGFKASWVWREDAPRHSQQVTVPMGANPADAFNAAMNERAATATRPPAAILAIAGRVGR